MHKERIVAIEVMIVFQAGGSIGGRSRLEVDMSVPTLAWLGDLFR